LIPSFLSNDKLDVLPLSILVGAILALLLGLLLNLANGKMNKKPLAIFMIILTAWLAVGLFAGGLHEFEEAAGETPHVFEMEGQFWNHKKFPMALFKPFGYSQSPTQLQVASFWIFASLIAVIHYVVYLKSFKKKTPSVSYELENQNP